MTTKKSNLFYCEIKNLKITNPKWFLIYRNKKDKYFDFIESCRSKEYIVDPNNDLSQIHIHHIIPRYLLKDTPEEKEYCDTPENLIELSVEDHITAHQLYYAINPTPQNFGAIQLLINATENATKAAKQAGAYKSHEVQRENKTGIFNPDVAKKAAQASMARPDAIQIRSEAGKKGGRNRQANRIISPEDKYTWYHNPDRMGSGTQTKESGEPKFCTFNCSTGGEIVEILKKYYPCDIERISDVLTGKRKSAFGFSAEKMNDYLQEDFTSDDLFKDDFFKHG